MFEVVGVTVIVMKPEHLVAVRAIEQQVSSVPWSDRQFSDSVQTHCARVFVMDEKVSGFGIYQKVLDRAELLNIAIHPSLQGQGFGQQLLTALVEELPMSVKKMLLEVRVSNFRAIRLYHNQGFRQIGERKGYYATADGLLREDALVLCRDLMG
tara:strand:+ start:263 stop:724 length:462 start_codon:yes stop_codon:yes gene_type:complete